VSPHASLLPALVGALLLVASWTDLKAYRIPNWIPAAILGLYPVHILLARTPAVDVAWHAAAFAAVLVPGLALFASGQMGGGDAKLLAAVSVWVGWAVPLLHLILLTTLFGAALSVVLLLCRRAPLAALANAFLRDRGWALAVLDPETKAVPYAVAVAAAFLALQAVPE
jgi:prepilin peptidase CpaA